MFETTGSLALVQPVLTLVGLVALPLLWAVIAIAFSRPVSSRPAHDGVIAPVVAISAAVGTFSLAVVLAARLVILPHGFILFQHIAQLGRLGQLDLAFDLALDPRSAVFAVLVGLVACASTLHTAWSSRTGAGGTFGWTGLVTAGAMTLCVGDGFAAILVGLGLLGVGGWGLSRGAGLIANATSLAGNAAILVGLVFLFWSLGGVFGPEGYDTDGAPRFVLVSTGAPSEDPAKATLMMTTHAGALVSSDDADLPHEPIASPFAVAVEPGIYSLRVQGGAATGDVVVPRVSLVAGKVHVLTPYGPTASLRVLDDQVAVPRIGANGAPALVRIALAGRSSGGLRMSAIVLLLLVGGALAHTHALANRRGASAVISVLEAVPAAYLALRAAPLVDPSSADGALVALLGAGSALLIGANAASVDDGYQSLRCVLGAVVSVAVAAAGLGDASASLVLSVVAIIGSAGALAAIDARRDVRFLGASCAAVVGIIPGAGTSTGLMIAIATALGSATTGSATWALFTAGVAVVLVGTAMLAALAAFRVYDAVLRASQRDPSGSRGQGMVAAGLAAVALSGGAVLGFGTSDLGGGYVSLSRRIAGPPAFPIPVGIGVASIALAIIATVGGVVLARRASVATTPPRWLLSFGRPYAILAWVAGVVAEAARFLQRSVRAMDRDVVDDVPAAARELVARVVKPRREPSPAAGAVDLDAPHPSERSLTVVLLAMVALLVCVVASSFVLG